MLNRISQDLAKDLAMLAREIHDVAGEIDSVSPAATDPGVVVLSKYLTVVDQQNMDVVVMQTKTNNCNEMNLYSVIVGGM